MALNQTVYLGCPVRLIIHNLVTTKMKIVPFDVSPVTNNFLQINMANKFFIIATYLLIKIIQTSAQCANQCSGHGNCDIYSRYDFIAFFKSLSI